MVEKVIEILHHNGLCGKYTGYLYIIECIKFIERDPMVLNGLCKELYVDVGKRFSVNGFCIERNMRYAIKFLYRNGAFEQEPLSSIFLGQKMPPSNKVFLCLLSEYGSKNINKI